ncbi:MAG: HlyD family efflux transporter periplasmic adaptor subunit [Burkholderiales bacterium]|nr:HlyD family efflux transporter periplasmic adaptor subunit [Burkholderiales bacterium]
MSQGNLQVWLEQFCVPRAGISGGVIMVAKDAQASPALAAAWPPVLGQDQRLVAAATAALDQQRSGGNAASRPYRNDGVVSLPLKSRNQALGVVALQLRAANMDWKEAIRETPAQPAAGPDQARADKAPGPSADARALVRLHAAVMACDSFSAAARAAAAGLAEVLGCTRVAVGKLEGRHCRVVALSHGELPAAGNALMRVIADAMDEAMTQEATIVVPALPGGRGRVTLAHAELARRGSGAAIGVPLSRAAQVFGVIVFERSQAEPPDAAAVARAEEFACLIGPALDLFAADERPWFSRLFGRSRQAHSWKGRAIGAGLTIALAALLAWPGEHWLGAPARIEGSVQRVVAAPTDGFVKTVHVRPGDLVTEGHLLAEMAGEDLDLEKRKLEAEIAQHESAVRAALARDDRAQYATAAARADAAAAQLGLIDEQRGRSRLTAPIAGVVIKGDLTQSLGAPVARGDVLITLAPAGSYRLIVEVDERDMLYLAQGAVGSLTLAALPETPIGFRVSRITPVAIARDGRNAFEVEGALDAPPAGLRPGLQGVVRIRVGERALGWVWGHRLLDWLRVRLWALGV